MGLKNGLFHEDGKLIYYKDGEPEHSGAAEVDGFIYYISSRDEAVKGSMLPHRLDPIEAPLLFEISFGGNQGVLPRHITADNISACLT